MTGVGWKASFKKDEKQFDGLATHSDDIIKDPLPARYALVRLETHRVVDMVQEGIQQAVVSVKHVELVTDQADVLRVAGMMQRIYAKRTGRNDGDQPSLFDQDQEEAERKALADEGDEILAERAEAAAAVFEAGAAAERTAEEAETEALKAGEPWPGDVEFQAPDGEAVSGDVTGEAESSAVKRSARKPRK